MGHSYISKRLERTAKKRDRQKNELSVLAPKCFSHLWPQGPKLALEAEEMISLLSDQSHLLGMFWVLKARQLSSSPLQM